jgi:hypothetical protein
MPLFRTKKLNYRHGDGTLAHMSKTRYFPHVLPGEKKLPFSIDAAILQEESNSGMHHDLVRKVIDFSHSLEIPEATFDYKDIPKTTNLHDPKITQPGNDLSQQSKFLVNLMYNQLDKQSEIYAEFIPFLKTFDEKMNLSLNKEQRHFIMFCFKTGMALALFENKSGVNINGYCHPSISNILFSITVTPIIVKLIKPGSWEFGNTGPKLNTLVGLAMQVGYFHTKYTEETPESVMFFLKPTLIS